MKRIIILLLIVISFSAYTQATLGMYAVNEITLELDAYQFETISKDGYDIYTLIVPDFYDLYIVKSKINRLVQKYSDVSYIESWKYDKERGFFNSGIKFSGLYINLGYHPESKAFMLLFETRHGSERL